jgi:hypothetical protein
MATDLSRPTEAPPRGRDRQLKISWLLLAGWCALWTAWLAAARARLPICPTNQRCDRGPLLTSDDIVGHAAVALAGAAGLAALCWWESRRSLPAPDTSDEMPTRRVRRIQLYALSFTGVLAAAHLMLLAPMIDHPGCSRPVRLNAVMAYPFNCDSRVFLYMAHDPGSLLDFHNMWQSRPGYIALSAVGTWTIGPVADALGIDRWYGQTDSAYIPLVLLNFVVAAAAVALLAWLLARLGAPPWAAVAMCTLLAVNDVTKAFYWSPHQQMFALLVPVGTIALARWVLLSRPPWWALALAGLGTGLVSLVYGSVLITVGVVGLVLLARGWRGLVLGGVFGGAFLVPTAIWMGVCQQVAGSYYNHATEGYHEFVWLPQAARAGTLPSWLEMTTIGTVRELVSAAGLPLLMIVVLAAAAVVLGVRLVPGSPEQRAILVASALTAVGGVAFAWGIGFIANRLMFNAVPGLLVGVGWLAARLSTRAPRLAWVGLGLVAFGVVAVTVTAEGPYS